MNISTSLTTVTIPLSKVQMEVIGNRLMLYSPIVILIFGVIGSFCSFLTFTASSLRKNACSFYFLVCAVFEFFSITFCLISSFSSILFGSNLTTTNRMYCKIRAYLVYAIPLASTYLVLLASFDRFMLSSTIARCRSFSHIKIARRVAVVMILFAFISCIHVPIGYDIRPRCSPLPGSFSKFDGWFVIIWLGTIPHLLMLIFGCFTFLNIHRTRRRVRAIDHFITSVGHTHRRDQKTNNQLILVSRNKK